MQHKPFFKLFVTVMSITMIFAYCKKGDVGPAGPAGPTGATGATGSTGVKGDTGTANVIYSAWLNVTYTADTFRATGNVLDTAGFYTNIAAAKLTAAIINSGEIKVYWRTVGFGGTTNLAVYPLPYFDVIYDFISLQPEYYAGRIFIYATGNYGTYTSGGVTINQYRYILIPGAVNGRVAQTIDWNDYNKVKEYLNLKD